MNTTPQHTPSNRSLFVLVGFVAVLAILFVILGIISRRQAPLPAVDSGDAALQAAEFLRQNARTDITVEERVAASEYLKSTAPQAPDPAKLEQIAEVFGN